MKKLNILLCSALLLIGITVMCFSFQALAANRIVDNPYLEGEGVPFRSYGPNVGFGADKWCYWSPSYKNSAQYLESGGLNIKLGENGGPYRTVLNSAIEADATYRAKITFKVNSNGRAEDFVPGQKVLNIDLVDSAITSVVASGYSPVNVCDEYQTLSFEFQISQELKDRYGDFILRCTFMTSYIMFGDKAYNGTVSVDITEFNIEKAEQYTIIGKADSDTSVKFINKNDGEVYYELDVAPDSEGRFEAVLNFYDDAEDFELVADDGKNIITKDMSRYVETTDGKIIEPDYFADIPESGLYIDSFSVNGEVQPYYQTTVPEGNAVITAKITSVDYSGDAALVVIASDNGAAKQIAVDTAAVNAGDSDIEMSVSLTSQCDEIKLFVLNSLENMQLLSREYVIDTKTTVENKFSDEYRAVTAVTSEFNPVTEETEITADSVVGTVTALVAKANTNFADISADNINDYIAGIVNSESDVIRIKLDDTRFSDGVYSAYAFGVKNTQDYEYVTPETLKAIYAPLNTSTYTLEDVDECVTNPKLKLDLSDYNLLTDRKEDVAAVFMTENDAEIASVNQLQSLLEVSAGTILLLNSPKREYIEKYGAALQLNERLLEEYLNSAAGSGVSDIVADLMNKNASDTKKPSTEYVRELFADAYVTARVNTAETYGQLKELIVEEYSDYIDIDESLIAKNGVNGGDVYKDMLDKVPFENITDIEGSFEKAVSDNEDDDSPKRGGGGGGTGRVTQSAVFPAVPQTEPDITVNDKHTFADVSENFWAYDCISELLDKGIISEAENYRPNDAVTREEFVKMAVIAFCGDVDGEDCSFTDADKNEWYFKYIAKAYSAQLVLGRPDGSFGIGENISRQDMAVIIDRIINSDDTEADFAFNDSDEISGYAQQAVKNMHSLGIINGDENYNFMPERNATRAECAKIIAGAMKANNR